MGRSQFRLLTPSTVVGTGSDTLVEDALVRIMGSGRAKFGPKALAQWGNSACLTSSIALAL